MQTITSTGSDAAAPSTPAPTPGATPVPRRRPQRWLAAAAVAAVATIGATVVLGGTATEPAAADVVLDAAAALGAVDQGRATLVQTYPDGDVWTFEAEFDGRDSFQAATSRNTDGDVLATWEITSIGTSVVTVEGEVVQRETLEADQILEPFAESSAAVIRAALAGDDGSAVDRGEEVLAGVAAQRYQIEVTPAARAALAQLSPGQLAWFALESPDQVAAIEVWVTDDVVRRIEVDFTAGSMLTSSRTDVFDLGAEIEIRPVP